MVELVPYAPEHSAAAMRLARKMHEEATALRSLPFDEAKLTKLFNTSISAPAAVYFVLSLQAGVAFGLLLGLLYQPYYSSALVAGDLAVYVEPEHRGGSTVVRLIKDFEKWGQSHGAARITLGQSTGVFMERTTQLYERLGYKTVGQNTVKEF